MGEVAFESIAGIHIMEAEASVDNRGSFVKLFNSNSSPIRPSSGSFGTLAIAHNPKKGTLRGLHFQLKPFAEEKLIFCITGRIFDVVVDLRIDSKTFGKWAQIEMNADSKRGIFLPEGLAHGYQTMAENTRVFYALTSEYNKTLAKVLDHADKTLSIPWPFACSEISNKDQKGISLPEAIRLLG